MFSTLRNRFGIPGVISVIALVFALVGGAFAANNGGSENGATASAKKAIKGPRGPRGPRGATGAAGPAGPAGAKGDTGAAGANGEKGATGTAGANGKSVSLSESAPGCPEGGIAVQVAGEPTTAKEICNGVGEEGSPWTAGGTLPPGATETGTFVANGEGGQAAAVSFAIPLASAPEESEGGGRSRGGRRRHNRPAEAPSSPQRSP